MAKLPAFSIYFFADTRQASENKYSLLLNATKFADAHGFSTVWVPERHFQVFGGLYPSPSLTGAALSTITSRIRIHAGSVVAPLNQALRVAEEWAVIDNLSNGRAGVAFASGWVAHDFVLAPQNYERRREITLEIADTVKKLWKGETVTLPNGLGAPTPTRIYPRPIQPDLPVWLTAQSDDTFVKAGELGYNVLTNYNQKTRALLGKKITLYRDAIQRVHNRRGHVTLMAHTYVASDEAQLQRVAAPALHTYLDVNLELQSDRLKGQGMEMSEDDRKFLKERAVQQFIKESGFIVVEKELGKRSMELAAVGVDEIACLVDFGVEEEAVIQSLEMISKFAAANRA